MAKAASIKVKIDLNIETERKLGKKKIDKPREDPFSWLFILYLFFLSSTSSINFFWGEGRGRFQQGETGISLSLFDNYYCLNLSNSPPPSYFYINYINLYLIIPFQFNIQLEHHVISTHNGLCNSFPF